MDQVEIASKEFQIKEAGKKAGIAAGHTYTLSDYLLGFGFNQINTDALFPKAEQFDEDSELFAAHYMRGYAEVRGCSKKRVLAKFAFLRAVDFTILLTTLFVALVGATALGVVGMGWLCLVMMCTAALSVVLLTAWYGVWGLWVLRHNKKWKKEHDKWEDEYKSVSLVRSRV